MQQNLIQEIYSELDMVRIMSRMSVFAIETESKEAANDSLKLIFKDIEKRTWNVSEFLEKIENSTKI